VLVDGLALALIGIAVGLMGALASSRILASFLFAVRATDPYTFLTVTGLLLGIALIATYVPARHAAKVDPVLTLRNE
jgi:ABC-type antimicrobial peptide transport system permease subunit